MVTRHPREYRPTSQQDLAIFHYHILFWPTKCTLLQAIKYGSLSMWPGLKEKLISNYLPQSEITNKGHLDQQKQRLVASSAANVTPLATNAGKNTSKLILQIFDPTEEKNSDLTGIYSVQSDRVNNHILVVYHYDANDILTAPLKNIIGPCILNGITKIHDKWRKRGLTPKLHIMDNEVSEDLKRILKIQTYISNWCHQTCIREILQKVLWKHSRTTLLTPYEMRTLSYLLLMVPRLTPGHHYTQHVTEIPTKPWTISLWTGRRHT